MSPEDIKKLLGGYATGTLTAEERQALFAAALEDQELFDALAREQSLRDLLRDPAARAELLSALDTPASRLGGFWQWLRRPVVAGLATAGVVAIAVVALWQVNRIMRPFHPGPDLASEISLVPAPPPPPPLATQPEAEKPAKSSTARFGATEKPLPDGRGSDQSRDRKGAVALGKSTIPRDRSTTVEADVAAPAMPPPPPPPAPAAMPALMARKTEAESTAAGRLAATTQSIEVQASTGALDARALFYLNQSAPGANAFVQPSGGGGGARPPPAREVAPRTDAAPRTATAVSGLAATATMTATAPRLGVRVSILRNASEVDLTTVLDPGETVRLKLIPNADGFLYVAEGARMVASGAAQRLKPFETPELRFEGSGQKQLYVMLSRRPQTVVPASLGTLARGNLVETSADRDRATYVVSGLREAGAQQVVVPVTLTYR